MTRKKIEEIKKEFISCLDEYGLAYKAGDLNQCNLMISKISGMLKILYVLVKD